MFFQILLWILAGIGVFVVFSPLVIFVIAYFNHSLYFNLNGFVIDRRIPNTEI